MAKREYKILAFEGGTNNKDDARDIADNQNALSQMSISSRGRLVMDGTFKNLSDYISLAIDDVSGGGTVADSTSFKPGHGLFRFSHDYDMNATPGENPTDFVCINDGEEIDIWDTNKSVAAGWNTNQLNLGKVSGKNVKPVYHNVDGALRVCDSNIGDTTVTTGETITEPITTTTEIALTFSASAIPSGSTIKIDDEIMFVSTGFATGGDITAYKVIRGYAHTKAATHLDNAVIYYVNVPKYLGHIGGTSFKRLSECGTPTSAVNIWTEDVMTPQPPNNTRKGNHAKIGNSYIEQGGEQSLRVYETITSGTGEHPSEAEKVVLEFAEGVIDFGIKKVVAESDVEVGNIEITTSGFGASPTAGHGLQQGDKVIIGNLVAELGLAGEHEIVSAPDTTTFKITIPNYLDSGATTTTTDYGTTSTFFSTDITAFASYDIPDTLKVTANDDFIAAGTSPYIHITGETTVTAFNGVYQATQVDDTSNAYIKHGDHASGGDAANDGAVQTLIGTITIPGDNSIDSGLRARWNFAMSFTYDGPGTQFQESLLTQGYKITPVTDAVNNGTLNQLTGTIDASTSTTTLPVDDALDFTTGDILLIDSEQIKVGTRSSNDLVNCVRAYNGSAAAEHTASDVIYKVQELSSSAYVDWTDKKVAQRCTIKTAYSPGTSNKSWHPRINGFRIYMKKVSDEDVSDEWLLFAHADFNKGTYQLLAADEADIIFAQPAVGFLSTLEEGTDVGSLPVDSYTTENLHKPSATIDVEYKTSALSGRFLYVGNIKQGNRTYPDRMLRTAENQFDKFPDSNFIDVAVGDGDEIIKLESFGDRLLQFKKEKVFIINTGGDDEELESEHSRAGISAPSQVCKTSDGICWFNEAGLWHFNGTKIENLTKDVEDEGYTILALTSISQPRIGYDRISNRVIFAPLGLTGLLTPWYSYDFNLKSYNAYNYGLLPYSTSGANYYTNMIQDSDGGLLIGFTSIDDTDLFNVFKWSNTPRGDEVRQDTFWKGKDIDFGSPGINKKIYKVYVTYKCTTDSACELQYATDGSGSFVSFSSTKSKNYTNGTFDDTASSGLNPVWKVAELKPSSSINNIKSIQLRLQPKFPNSPGYGTVQAVSGNDITLVSGEGSFDYDEHSIGIHGGDGRYNVRRISNYVVGTRVATLSTGTDYGYGANPNTSSTYQIATPANFEINDITIIYRIKKVK